MSYMTFFGEIPWKNLQYWEKNNIEIDIISVTSLYDVSKIWGVCESFWASCFPVFVPNKPRTLGGLKSSTAEGPASQAFVEGAARKAAAPVWFMNQVEMAWGQEVWWKLDRHGDTCRYICRYKS